MKPASCGFFVAEQFAYWQKQLLAEEEKAIRAAKAQKKKEGVRVGMSKQDVIESSWGRPEKVNATTTAAGTREQWVYGGGNYLYFNGDTLVTIQTGR